MADRRCPYCGEFVPRTNITCPKCYRKIPVEPEPVQRESEQPRNGSGRRYNRILAILLSVIPGLFGILGLGLIYRNPHQKIGYVALVLGLLFFIAAMGFTIGVLTVFLAVPCWIIYALGYLGCLVLVLIDNISFRVF